MSLYNRGSISAVNLVRRTQLVASINYMETSRVLQYALKRVLLFWIELPPITKSQVDFSGTEPTYLVDFLTGTSGHRAFKMATVLIAIDESKFAENAFRCKYYNIRPYWDCMGVKYEKFSYRRIIRCTFMSFILSCYKGSTNHNSSFVWLLWQRLLTWILSLYSAYNKA